MANDPPAAPAALATQPARPGALRRALAQLRRWLFGSRSPRATDPLLEDLFDFDVEDLLTELRIREKAVENGLHEIPATSDVQPDGPQALLMLRAEQAIREGRNHLERHLAHLTRRIRSTDVAPECRALAALPAALRDDLDGLIRLHGERIAPLRERHRALRAQLREFRERFGIRFEPRAPESHVLHVGVLVVVLAAESVLNGVYFAKADPLGFLGGVGTAFGIALINVAASFFLGRVAVCVTGARPGFRALGALAAAVFLVWAFGYNLVIAHARDLLGSAFDADAIRHAFERISEAPFGFTNVDSWLLFGLGVLFSAVAFADGVRWDDPTPGYSRLAGRAVHAREDWLHERRALDEDGRALLARRSEELRDGAERTRFRLDVVRNDVEQKRLLAARAASFFRHTVDACNTALRIYRDLNRQQRSTAPPAYFQTSWSHAEPEPAAPDLADDERRVRAQEALWQEIAARREALARELEAEHTAFVARARTLRDEDEVPDEPAPRGAARG